MSKMYWKNYDGKPSCVQKLPRYKPKSMMSSRWPQCKRTSCPGSKYKLEPTRLKIQFLESSCQGSKIQKKLQDGRKVTNALWPWCQLYLFLKKNTDVLLGKTSCHILKDYFIQEHEFKSQLPLKQTKLYRPVANLVNLVSFKYFVLPISIILSLAEKSKGTKFLVLNCSEDNTLNAGN